MTRRVVLAAALLLAGLVSPLSSPAPAQAMPYGGQAEFVGTGVTSCGSSCSIWATSAVCTYTAVDTSAPSLGAGQCTATLTAFLPMCIGGSGILTLSAPGVSLSIPVSLVGGPHGMTFAGSTSIPAGTAFAEGFVAPACIPPSAPVVFGGSVQWAGN